MSTFTKERHGIAPSGGGRKTGMGKDNSAPMRVRPGFNTGNAGKAQPRDRSGGAPKQSSWSGMPLDYPQKDGI